jgi:signal transduction histidine kinase
MVTFGIVLLIGLAAIAIFDSIGVRETMVREMTITADMAGSNLTASIVFDDRKSATAILEALHYRPNIVGVAIYDRRGSVFTHMSREKVGGFSPSARPHRDGYEFIDGGLIVVRPLRDGSQRIGTIVVVSDLSELWHRGSKSGTIFLIVLICLMLISYPISARMQRSVTDPILKLAETARRITDEQNYQLRVEKTTEDETGILIDRFNAMLEAIRERDLALQREILKLRRSEDANRELQLFASIASHDLQEPLRKVQAFADRILASLEQTLDDRQRDYFDRMLRATKRMQRLINDLLTYSRVTTRAKPFEPVDLSQIASEVVDDLEITIEQAQGTVRLGYLPKIDADGTQMRQLFQNLIGNALKYHRPDLPPVVHIDGEFVENPAHAQTISGRTFCRLTIRDNGIGFEQKYAEQIFVIFQRLHGKNEYQGTGIGLAICRKIAERHGGSIVAEGTPGSGAVFTVMLPVSHEETVLDALVKANDLAETEAV